MTRLPEEILDECIAYLKAGQPVAFCIKKYPHIRGLKQFLLVAESALRLPKKQARLDQSRVWNRISSRLTESVVRNAAPRQRSWGFVFSKSFGIALGVMIVIGGLNGATAASKNSIPGETLYPVKRTVEKLELTLAFDQAKKTELRIKHAEHRLTEAQAIVQQKSPAEGQELQEQDSQVIKKAIDELADTTTQVAGESTQNSELLKKVVELTDKQEEVLPSIQSKVSGETKKSVTQALDTAVETKSAAEHSLAQMENDDDETTLDSAATSTDKLNDEEDVKGAADEKDEDADDSSTSTSPILRALGKPGTATTTDADSLPEFGNETSTPEIIDLPLN